MPDITIKRTHLTNEERFKIAHLAALGQAPTRIAASIGRDKTTVLNAVRNDEQVIKLIGEQRESLAELFEDVARRALMKITDEKLESANCRDLGVLAGISVDKFRLISGASTMNHLVLHAQACFEASLCWGNGHIIEAEEGGESE